MNEVEGKVLNMYDKSRPVEEDLFETSHVNQVAWTLAVLFGGLVIWLMIALVNAENQRYALVTKKCADPLFKGEIDQQCLVMVQSRDHWWEHLGYAMTHVRQTALKK
ncbi:hypothetical protein Q4S45_03480 [Massilia sp. R2A-15]|uniref:hypothetical protein n=1 Tax=Massilia sp. R2A-15 TaxID=3064278 RepID=UPI002735BDCB|nr:hypothetical protein [Massilia sp. R2A-15]WLI90198.1 hypothetical protein Q4S45_03480 [Massilia sp. R2A-15]